MLEGIRKLKTLRIKPLAGNAGEVAIDRAYKEDG